MSAANLERLKEELGLNRPVYVRYFAWLGQMAQGNFGYSYQTGEPVLRRIGVRLPATLELMGFALVVSSLLGTCLGVLAALKQYTIWDYALDALRPSLDFDPLLLPGAAGALCLCVEAGLVPHLRDAVGGLRRAAGPVGQPAPPGAARNHSVAGPDGRAHALHALGHAGGAGAGVRNDGAGQGSARDACRRRPRPAQRPLAGDHHHNPAPADSLRRHRHHRDDVPVAGDGPHGDPGDREAGLPGADGD